MTQRDDDQRPRYQSFRPETLREVAAANDTQRVMIVNGCFGILELIEATLEAGRYHVAFVESNARAYSQIKRVRPALVVLCMRLDHLDGFHVLSMLKLDAVTRDIPVLTFTMPHDSHNIEEEALEPLAPEMFAPKRVELMN